MASPRILTITVLLLALYCQFPFKHRAIFHFPNFQGSAIGPGATAGVAWKFSKSPHGTSLAFGAGALFGKEYANHALQLYRLDTMAAQVKFLDWWGSKMEVSFHQDKIWCLRTKGFGDSFRVRECSQRHVVRAVQSEVSSAIYEERWLLEPAGDGDWRHIGFKVAMPGSFEISSDKVTVGRVPEKADLVIPVATVSGVHACIEKKSGGLMVTDLDSTNGTFVGEKRLIPGVPVAAPPGSYITFGDTNLAIFRLLKIKNMKPANIQETSEAEAERPVSPNSAENSENSI